jgi:hypothetical protein
MLPNIGFHKGGINMSPQSKREYLEAVHRRYKNATRHEKTAILNEFCTNCGCHRKHAIRALRGFKRFTKPRPKKRGKPSVYQNAAVISPLKEIWVAANLPCSKRLKAMLPIWLPGYVDSFGELSEEVTRALLNISAPTIDRILAPVRIYYTKRGRSTTKPGTLLRKQIPIKTNQWDESRPGFLEADTVAHCGDSTQGMYVNTIDFVDITTGWTEQRAVWGKGEAGVLEQIKNIEKPLPFLVDLKIKPDNATPSVQFHYRTFLPTTGGSVPVPRIGTLILVDSPLEFLPYHRDDRFPRSAQEPGSDSRYLYAGCRPSSRQVSLELILESFKTPQF